jgi:hypothetical protein
MKDVRIEMSKKRRTQMKIKAIRLHHWEICGQKKANRAVILFWCLQPAGIMCCE